MALGSILYTRQHGKQAKTQRQAGQPWDTPTQKTKAHHSDSLGQILSLSCSHFSLAYFSFNESCTFLLAVCYVLKFFLVT